jgi:ribose transport system permease protein
VKYLLHRFRDYAALTLILAGMIILFGSLSNRFLTAATFSSIANEIPTLTLVATGMTLVLIIGGIDLSVGSVLALASAVLGVLLVDWHWPLFFGGLVAVMVGVAVGTFNGLICVKLRVPSFIVTLGTLEMTRGLAYLTTKSQVKYLDGKVDVLARLVAGLPITLTAVLAVLVVIAAQFMLSRAVIGRKMIALGTNEVATRLAGISTGPVKTLVFAASGGLAGLASLCQTARLGASDPNGSVGLELSAIAAAVIGGTSLSGGKGSVICTFIGVLIIATLEAGLAQVGATEPMKRLVTGAVIVLAVVADSLRKATS